MEAGLNIECVWSVMGGVGKEDNLFDVYVQKKQSEACDSKDDDEQKERNA